MPDFILDFRFVIYGAEDFVAEDGAIAFAEAVNGGADGVFGNPKLGGGFGAGQGAFAFHQINFEHGKAPGATVGVTFLAKPGEDAFEQVFSPAFFAGEFRRQGVGLLLPAGRNGYFFTVVRAR